jgi:hypothetical protein
MDRFARRFLSFTILATVLAGAAGPARAQTLEELELAILELNLPQENGLLHQIDLADMFIDKEKINAAVGVLNGLIAMIEANPFIDTPVAEDLVSFTESVIDQVLVGPTDWYCDYDGDGYTVYAGVSYLPPDPYCSNDPGLGSDSDDFDPNVNGALKEWWCDYDQDGYYFYMGWSYTAPNPYCVEDPGDGYPPGSGEDCYDFDPNHTCG